MKEQGKCRSCKADVMWLTTTNGNIIPIDAAPKVGGNIIIRDDGRCQYVSVLTQVELIGGKPRYVSHFVTCPHAKQWRKEKAAQRTASVLE